MKEKILIFDASTLITFSMNGLIGELKKLKEGFNGKFIITKDVKREIIDKPITIKKFELEALRLKKLLDEKILEMSSILGVSDDEISSKTEEFKKIANSTFHAREKDIHLIDSGEASCLALSKILTEKGIQNIIGVDERTTRMLGEKPENLHKLFEKKFHTKIQVKKENYKYFKGFTFIRSSELVYVAYKKGLVEIKDGDIVLDALLYAVKFKGCSISSDEIKEIKKIG